MGHLSMAPNDGAGITAKSVWLQNLALSPTGVLPQGTKRTAVKVERQTERLALSPAKAMS